MKLASFLGAMALLALVAGCSSTHDSSVTSDMHSQWVMVAADTKVTTDAAKSVLTSEGLKDVSASSTDVDGKATAKKADGTVVRVLITKEPNGSKAVVTVGDMGEPTLGADLAHKIKMKAEGA